MCYNLKKVAKKKYTANPYPFQTKDGKRASQSERAEGAAKFLEHDIWGKTEDANIQASSKRVIRERGQYDIENIRLQEAREAIRKFRRRKAPGPNEIPMEMLKELDDENLQSLVDVMNGWWENETMSDGECAARVVMIFKKGDASNLQH